LDFGVRILDLWRNPKSKIGNLKSLLWFVA